MHQSRQKIILLVLIAICQGSSEAASHAQSQSLRSTISNSTTQALAEAASQSNCFGRTDLPHVSTHFPNTVNVQAVTECPGQSVTIMTTLSRKRWWLFNESKTVTVTSFGKVKANVSLVCKWKSGGSEISYVATSFHSDSHGEFARTRTRVRLKC